MSSPRCWHLLTGEYPPQPGGVSDYTRLVARELARAGDRVHVWAPAWEGDAVRDDGVIVHPLADNFGPRACREVTRGVQATPGPRRLLVQYVPHAYGYRNMNVRFCVWLWRMGQRESVWVMFHEVCYPLRLRQPPRHNLLAIVQRLMAALVCRSAERAFLATPEWEPLLRSLAPPGLPMQWTPVPSNIPTTASAEAAAAVRRQVAPGTDRLILGHFGTFTPWSFEVLGSMLVELLRRDERRIALLIGRGGDTCAERLRKENPTLASRLIATGSLPDTALANHLAACDLLLQPYEDGVTSRRGSLMAGLALGRPIVASDGRRTASYWREAGAVRLVTGGTEAWVRAAEDLLADAAERARLGEQAAALYRERFAVEHTIQALRADCKDHLLRGTGPSLRDV